MSQRNSGHERKALDLYETPEWVTETLCFFLRKDLTVWEPACGSGKMVKPLIAAGMTVNGTDISEGQEYDFLQCSTDAHNAIITNPPYEKAYAFVVHAIQLMEKNSGLVAMLLRTDWDHAKGRSHLFTEWPFAQKIVLTKRIRWFEDSKGSPSFNHAWFIWDWKHTGAPTLAYGP